MTRSNARSNAKSNAKSNARGGGPRARCDVFGARARSVRGENAPTPRWALDTPAAAAAAAAARGVSRGGAHQFGPERDAARVYARGRGVATARQKHAAVVARRWTAKQLREVIREIADAKPASGDARRQAKHRRRRETMREHLYSHLNRKFGVPAVIEEWATSIVAALDAHAEEDCEIASFRLVLGNALDEEYRAEQRAISATVEELVRANVRSKHPTASEETLRAKTEAKLRGDLLEREWLDMVRFMYGRSDGAPLKARLRDAQRRLVDADLARELERVTIEHALPTDAKGHQSGTRSDGETTRDASHRPRENSRRRVCFTVCARGRRPSRPSRTPSRTWARWERACWTRRGSASCVAGVARTCARRTWRRRSYGWTRGTREKSPPPPRRAALTPGLEAEEKGEAARGLPAGEASRASLWGGGRGELTWGR